MEHYLVLLLISLQGISVCPITGHIVHAWLLLSLCPGAWRYPLEPLTPSAAVTNGGPIYIHRAMSAQWAQTPSFPPLILLLQAFNCPPVYLQHHWLLVWRCTGRCAWQKFIFTNLLTVIFSSHHLEPSTPIGLVLTKSLWNEFDELLSVFQRLIWLLDVKQPVMEHQNSISILAGGTACLTCTSIATLIGYLDYF